MVCLQAVNMKSTRLNKLKCLSKGAWDLNILKNFLEEFGVSKINSSWAVSVSKMGNFIIADSDFKDLKVAKGDLNVALITSSLEKVVIAIRCRENATNGDGLFLRRSEAGDRLKLIINEILCQDYNNFVGYILYKRLVLNLSNQSSEEQDHFDWFAEAFLSHKGASGLVELLVARTRDFEESNIEVYCGIYRDTECFPDRTIDENPDVDLC